MALKEPKSVQMGWYLAELVLMGIGSVHIHCQFCNQLPEGTELPSILIFRDHESWKRKVKIVKIALKTFFGGLWMTMTRPFCFVTLWSASKVLADFAHKNIWQLWTFFKCQKLFLNLHSRSTFGFFVTLYCKNGPLLWQNAKKAFLSFWCFKNGCFLFGQVALQAIFVYVMKLLLVWAGGWQKWSSNSL